MSKMWKLLIIGMIANQNIMMKTLKIDMIALRLLYKILMTEVITQKKNRKKMAVLYFR